MYVYVFIRLFLSVLFARMYVGVHERMYFCLVCKHGSMDGFMLASTFVSWFVCMHFGDPTCTCKFTQSLKTTLLGYDTIIDPDTWICSSEACLNELDDFGLSRGAFLFT